MRTRNLSPQGVERGVRQGVRRGCLALALALVAGLGAGVGTGCQQETPKAHLEAGADALQRKDYARALADAEVYLKAYPDGASAARAHYVRGQALELRPKHSEAEIARDLRLARAAYEEALRHEPEGELDGFIRAGLANVAYWEGNFAEAERQWTSAYDRIEDRELRSWVWYRVGLSQQRQGKWEQADATFDRVRQQHPGSEASARAAAHRGARAFLVHVATFRNPASAQELVASLRQQGHAGAFSKVNERGLHVVSSGAYKTYPEAVAARAKVLPRFRDALIVP